MAGTARLMMALLLGGTLAASGVRAQTAEPQTTGEGSQSLPTLPQPPAQPASLFAPAPPLGPPPPNLEQPYFQTDPLLDPPQLGEVGWFADVDVGILKPHLVNEESHAVTFPNGNSFTVGVDPAHLNWTAAPRVEVGYRLPAGFGGISVSYRNMTS
ncbi:MAG: hypothetical protein ACRELF_21325, partial [Gemmataceae bacterium]